MIFVDASAIVAMIAQEPEAERFVEVVAASTGRMTSAVAVYEAVLAVTRKLKDDLHSGEELVRGLLTTMDIRIEPITGRHADEALLAHARYGKGRGHPAQLNMGDCFAYAVAKSHDAALLYKGDDFIHTDIRTASLLP